MDCAHLPAVHPHSKLWGILAFSREPEYRSPTCSIIDADLTTVGLNDSFDDREPETGSLLRLVHTR
ncbi:MAG: hypothetical protein PVJ55_03310 [Anaerolineae bacterium]